MALGAVVNRLFKSKQSSGAAASANTPGNTLRKPNPHGGKDQGGTTPHDLHDSQPDPSRTKMGMGEKFSQGANIFGAGASIIPMLKGDPKPPKPLGDPSGLKGEELAEFQKLKIMTEAGPLRPNF